MKSNVKLKIIVLIILGILFTSSPIITFNLTLNARNKETSSRYSHDFNLDNENLKISAVSGKIHIADNWSAAKAAGICTGNGTYSEPYVIKDLEIDGEHSGSGIFIENSAVYFKIENCTVFNSGYFDAGIRLLNVNNSGLINNKCSSNYRGIILENCINNSISGNIASSNGYGIYLYNCSDNTLSGNIMNGCGLLISGSFEDLSSHNIDDTNLVNGKPLYYYKNEVYLGPIDFMNAGQVILVNCHDSLISDLDVSNSSRGISLYYCNENNISGNIANANQYGLSLDASDNNTITGNTANSNSFGIDLEDSNNNNVSGNTVKNNGYGIYLYNCSDNTLSGNNATNNGIGIYLYNCSDNPLSGNIMNGCGLLISGSFEDLSSHNIDDTNLVNGKPLYYYKNEVNLGPIDFVNAGQVILVNCNDSLIINLDVSHCSYGISLYYCNENNISRNSVYTNLDGIHLENSHNNTITGNAVVNINLKSSNNNIISRNTANNSYFGGIILSGSNNNILSGNTANNNYKGGIILSGSNNNTLSGNTANNHYQIGIFLNNSYDNIISGNIADKNNNGIYLYNCSDNTLSGNTLNNNTYSGIYVRYSNNNTLSGNIADNNRYGIRLYNCSDNTLSGNTLNNNKLLGMYSDDNYYGINLYNSDNNTLSGNTVTNNAYGIYLSNSNNNTHSGNIVNYNYMGGIILDENCWGNLIYLNCFKENDYLNAKDDGLNNRWDNGIKGNYWADYRGSDGNGNGIGDTPYNIIGSAGSQDNFPLMKCPSSTSQEDGGIPIELIILISIISGVAVVGVGTLLLIRRKRKRIE